MGLRLVTVEYGAGHCVECTEDRWNAGYRSKLARSLALIRLATAVTPTAPQALDLYLC